MRRAGLFALNRVPGTYIVLVTVLEVIQRSTEFLAEKGVDSPRLQTELLLAHLLRLPRMQLYLNFERALTDAELAGFRELIRRRGRREPLQHIVGSTSFCGLEITVNCHVLVPRPETELLAEQGWQFLNRLDLPGARPPAVLDWGTGSGCLAIALAVNCPAAQVHALDVSAEALDVARQNAGRHGVAERILFHHGDGFAALPPRAAFDLVVTNPPYIPTREIQDLQPEVRDYDPRAALDGGPDGLACYRRLAAEAARHLHPRGRIMLEFGDHQAEAVCRIFQDQKWIVGAVVEDYTHRARILTAAAGAAEETGG